jgi:drug/metabolite transporter (DMT)-like permease
MNIVRIIGVVLLIVGAVLIVVGVSASRSLVDNVSNFFTGHFTESTMWYIFGGVAIAVVGLLLAIGVIGRPRS